VLIVFGKPARSLAQDAGTRDVLRTFLLFGDPALRIVQ
jgi:hypothetical protein